MTESLSQQVHYADNPGIFLDRKMGITTEINPS